MKTIRRNTVCRIISLLMTVILLTAAVPSALADNVNLAGTRWYATGFNMDLIKGISTSLYEKVKLIASLIKFVPEMSWLDISSVMAFYCSITFYANGKCHVTICRSERGKTIPDSYTTIDGTWSKSGSMIRLTFNGKTNYVTCTNGVISITVNGFGLDFEQVS